MLVYFSENALADALRIQIRCLLAQLELLEKQRAILDDEIEQFMSHIEQHITSIPGIGPVTGAVLIKDYNGFRKERIAFSSVYFPIRRSRVGGV